MATYIVGDLHGCYAEFQALLAQAQFDPQRDMLYLTGDLVARGPQSLECLRWVKSLGAHAQMVLGNHDLHLLACALGIKKIKPQDRVETILQAEDREELLNWLRKQPLFIYRADLGFCLAHAGISPDWDLATTMACAKEVEQQLRSEHYGELLSRMYDSQPDLWQADLKSWDRWRYIINVFTRMRFCYADHRLDFACKLPLAEAPQALKAWYQLDNPLFKQQNIIFGHWASLVDTPTPANIYALDTGCAWGNRLTLLRWEDKKYFVQPSLVKAR